MIITLLTDFGSADGYVAEVKGRILSINPSATLVDLSHEVRPQDIREAAFILSQTYRAFPKGTIHVVVVDPGVGSARKKILVQTASFFFIGPDNGVFTLALAGERVERMVELARPQFFASTVSRTFHGRDVFGPAAAHVSLGIPVTAFGPRVRRIVKLTQTRASRTGGVIRGEVIHADRFGNLVTNIPEEWLKGFRGSVTIGETRVPYVKTYATVREGEPVALIGSAKLLEIAVNRGSAAERFGVRLTIKVDF